MEWELWIETNDECGYKCETQNAFLRDFKPIAQSLEKDGYTQFTPHFITWECIDDPPTPEACRKQASTRGDIVRRTRMRTFTPDTRARISSSIT